MHHPSPLRPGMWWRRRAEGGVAARRRTPIPSRSRGRRLAAAASRGPHSLAFPLLPLTPSPPSLPFVVAGAAAAASGSSSIISDGSSAQRGAGSQRGPSRRPGSWERRTGEADSKREAAARDAEGRLAARPCHTNYIPVCGSNGDTYQNECFLRRAACKHQKEITVVTRGPCYSDNGSGSGEGEYEGSGTEVNRKHSKCGVCKYRAECDEDAENVGCVCNIDCSGYSFNPVCASDGSSYNNPCFVREASCLRQEQIDIRHLGHCSESDDISLLGKKDDGMQYRPDVKDASDQREDIYIGNHIPCSESFNGYCIHGKCEFIYSTQKASCRCESGYTGQHCEKTDFSILYVVPSRQKLTHVLIAAIIGAVQIAIIVAIVMCITRKCPKNNRGRRQKQNLGHFTSDTSSRMV
ncbi:tomoregulin-1 isoform X3 [Hemicordylus capensis]|uniref:tomoregulin-1 isoform X3 n=1 Tax=Hemicordylus capensis TaxID=884348 RepID=UPI002303A215|nr:tomoregulin-1 isoform X3 [Hemicordylus capensis]